MRVLSKILVRVLFVNSECCIKNFEAGSAIAKPSALGIIVPVEANMKVLVDDKPNLIPKGIANFSSTNGVMAAKKIFNSGNIVMLV